MKKESEINDRQENRLNEIQESVSTEAPKNDANNYNNYNPDAQGKFVNWNSVPDSQELEARQAWARLDSGAEAYA